VETRYQTTSHINTADPANIKVSDDPVRWIGFESIKIPPVFKTPNVSRATHARYRHAAKRVTRRLSLGGKKIQARAIWKRNVKEINVVVLPIM
jgi:hypothetical protein